MGCLNKYLMEHMDVTSTRNANYRSNDNSLIYNFEAINNCAITGTSGNNYLPLSPKEIESL